MTRALRLLSDFSYYFSNVCSKKNGKMSIIPLSIGFLLNLEFRNIFIWFAPQWKSITKISQFEHFVIWTLKSYWCCCSSKCHVLFLQPNTHTKKLLEWMKNFVESKHCHEIIQNLAFLYAYVLHICIHSLCRFAMKMVIKCKWIHIISSVYYHKIMWKWIT